MSKGEDWEFGGFFVFVDCFFSMFMIYGIMKDVFINLEDFHLEGLSDLLCYFFSLPT